MFSLVLLPKVKVFHSCRARVVLIALVLHPCWTRVTRVSLVLRSCWSCCTCVSAVSLVSRWCRSCLVLVLQKILDLLEKFVSFLWKKIFIFLCWDFLNLNTYVFENIVKSKISFINSSQSQIRLQFKIK